MSDPEYHACINELYQGEVLGEQLFLAWAAMAKNEREKYHFGTLPTEDQDILQSMIKHEESFVHWIEKETAGEVDSLDVAISQLQYPLPEC